MLEDESTASAPSALDMSVFSDFRKAWGQRFPGSDLPAAWEEDVRANLAKHKARVAVLKEELEKEEFYVEYLERLLDDVEKHKHLDQVEKSSEKEKDAKGTVNEKSETEKAPPPQHTNGDVQSEVMSIIETASKAAAELKGSHYVTVIEVNGCQKKDGDPEGKGGDTVPASPAKKVPPRPPPKHFRKGGLPSLSSPSEEELPKLEEKQEEEAVAKEDGRTNGTASVEAVTEEKTVESCADSSEANSKEVPDTSSTADAEKPAAPATSSPSLPPPQRKQPGGLSNANNEGVRSKIQELLQKMEKSDAPLLASQVPAVGPRRFYTRKDSHEKALDSSEAEVESAEPLYDTVAADLDAGDYVLLAETSGGGTVAAPSAPEKCTDTLQSGASSNDLDGEATFKSQASVLSGHSGTTSSTTDTEGAAGSPLPPEGDSPKCANYVNIDFFLKRKARRKGASELESQGESLESDDEAPPLLRTISSDREDDDGRESRDEVFDVDSGVYSSSVESTSAIPSTPPTPPGVKKWKQSEDAVKEEAERMTMYKCIINSIIESEKIYVECLSVMLQYMKALKATLTTSQPVLTQDEFGAIFFKIPELHALHQSFLEGLQKRTQDWDGKFTIGDHFKMMANKINTYGSFLQNYGRAIDTVRQCSQNNAQFADITRDIRLRSLQGQPMSLEDLLHKPVARVQKNALVLHDLIKYTPESHPDNSTLKQALKMIQCFLNEFNMIQTETLFPSHDRAQRHLVKNSFIVELSEGHRKLRHLFLFNDVIVCAKYKASGKNEKYTFELKWYIPLGEIVVQEEPNSEPRESSPVNLVVLKSQASTVRDQIMRQESREEKKQKPGGKAEKHRKKLAELEAQLVLASPNLVFRVGHRHGKMYTFFLSSEFERSQWYEAIQVVQAAHNPSATATLNMYELQAWITACRKFLKTNMGSYLLLSGRDESLLVGDLHVMIEGLQGLARPAVCPPDLYVCLEVDSYGHYFRKAKTKMVCNSVEPVWNQDFIVELEGSQNLRILLYEENQCQGTLLRGKATLELGRAWLNETTQEQRIQLQEFVLSLSLKFIPSEMTLRRVPAGKPSGLFGAKIHHVCKREKRSVPFIITSCIREVEKRGMNEVGVYRVSGSASDVSRLKKAYESNSYEAEQMLKEVDIHSVTGILKMYLRELPEALFTDELYPLFFEAFNHHDLELKRKALLHLFTSLPPANQSIIIYLLDHMVKVNQHEGHNKMSLHNLATVFGPTLLRPGSKCDSGVGADLLAAGTVDVMAQAGILYFFIQRRARGENFQAPGLVVDESGGCK